MEYDYMIVNIKKKFNKAVKLLIYRIKQKRFRDIIYLLRNEKSNSNTLIIVFSAFQIFFQVHIGSFIDVHRPFFRSFSIYNQFGISKSLQILPFISSFVIYVCSVKKVE